DVITAYEDAARTHTYSSPGTYTITIYGQLYGWRFDNNGDRLKLGDISQWGNKFRFVSSGGAAPSSYALASSEGEIEALTVAGGYVWAGTNTAPGKLIRYNPTASTHETTSLQAGEDYIYGMTSDGTSVYAVDWDVASNIIRFDAASGARIAAYPTGVGNLFSMTFDGTYVWAASMGAAAKLVRFNPATLQLDVYDLTGATGGWSIVSVGDFIYGVSGTGLFRFNKTSLATDTVTLTGASSARGLAFDGANLWVTTDQVPMRLIKVNPETLAFEVTTMPSGIDGSEGLIFDGANLWSTMRYAEVSSLLKIPVNDIGAATIATLSIAKNATQAITFDGSKVWTASYTAPSSIFGIGKSYWPSDGYFYGCSNMTVSASDAPDMTGTTSMANAFRSCANFNSDISHWDVSQVQSFDSTFKNTNVFNQNLNSWDTGSGTSFANMFSGTVWFNNGDPGNNGGSPLIWNVANGTLFTNMFNSALRFNQDISSWDMRNATSINSMFSFSTFNNGDATNSQSKPLSWYLPKVTSATFVFYSSGHPFDQDIGSWFTPQNGDVMQVKDLTHALCHRSGGAPNPFNNGGSPSIGNWRTPNATSMFQMLAKCNLFNQPIGNWDVSSVTNMEAALFGTSSFNQDLSAWNTGNVTNMSSLFGSTAVFNNGEAAGASSRPLPWNVSKVTNFNSMFSSAGSFNQDISAWDTSSATDMASMFLSASSFNSNISAWNVSKVTSFNAMFNAAVSFRQNLSNWSPTAGTDFTNIFATNDINTPGTTDNYDNFLLKVASVTNQNTRSLGGGSARYSFTGLGSAASSTGRAFLATSTSASPNPGRGWTVSDGGSADCTFSSSSGLLVTYSGDRPTFSQVVFKTNGTLPTGLTAGTTYWTVRVSGTTARLATSLANAQAGTVISFTDAGSGTHSVMNRGHVFTASNSSGNLLLTLTTGGDLNFSGRRVRFSTTGTLPAGISAGVDYRLNRVSATTYRVTTTATDAVSGTNFITFTDSGTGTHELMLQ
ncbi:MAG: BspA family leucine-rich repeat surface protein, partial [Pseudomonadota bacterium]